MEKEQVSKRLYVGGLGHTVSKAELEERFGKFGHVLDAEIITRKDEQGNPVKTFAYVSVSISDADLKKCMSVLNKTKWKGGTLQIELAKESFLHRLATEREESKLKKEKPQRNKQMCLLESLEKNGVVGFHMKAVPGTEVPEHKKWVVGKFGRVLPVLHLRNQQKNKISFSYCCSLTQTNIVKYDPSKYCHNLRKLEPDLAQAAPVSQLTWHLEGRDESTGRKRQGEFPGVKEAPKKLRQLGSESLDGAAVPPSGCQAHPTHSSSPQLQQKSNPTPRDKDEEPPPRNLNNKTPGRGLLSDQSLGSAVTAQSTTSVSDSDVDSEEEIRAMVKKEAERQKVGNVETESDHLEVVGDNFGLKYNSHWSLSNFDAMKKAAKGNYQETMECDNGYDSADTDEIIAESKTPDPNSSKTANLENSKQGKEENEGKKSGLVNGSSLKTRNLKEEHIGKKGKIKKSRIAALQRTAVNGGTETSDGESSYSESEQGESEISSDYESMMQNCYRLDLSLDDLKALAAKNTGTPAEESDGAQSSGQSSAEENTKSNVNNPKLSKCHPAVKKKSICPEDVLADILAGGNEESSKGQNNSHLKYQPFRGMGSLCVKESSRDSTGLKKNSVESLGLEACTSYRERSSKNAPENHPLCPCEVSSKKRQNLPCGQHRDPSAAASVADQSHQPVSRPRLHGKNKDVSSLQAQSSERGAGGRDGGAAGAQEHVKQPLKSPRLLPKNLNGSNKNPEREASTCENGETSLVKGKELGVGAAAAAKEGTREKQVQDNQRRLAALQERHRERQLQKKLIQGALSNLDNQPAGKHKHIIFDSDVENEAEVEETLKKDAGSGNRLGEVSPKPSGKLFDSSEDEQDDTDDERFKIKPQFEGKAGEKLLQLQSRFGTDERFRMDARFLESDSEEEDTNSSKADEEEELAAEKKKNLQILGSLLNVNLEQPKPNKTATSAKKFKDINALRYDPTRQDHAVFERKPSATEKESKAKKKKKKEKETKKPPQVSEKIYYHIAADLKDLFGSSKSKPEKQEEIPWDKEEGEDSAPPDHLGPVCGNNTAQDSSGFKFSFFADAEQSDMKEEPYILETIKPVKVTWQEDPRFQDSSSEGDDEPEASETEKDQEMQVIFLFRESTRFFFFSKDDERLREGPKLFCRSADLSEDKDGWEDRRRLLLEECRKKHKDAKRKVKAK
ncbi:NOL8 protein, partial [Sapayoa aenigma]|nr:NOL8 protein [Sapayoa aenigma]